MNELILFRHAKAQSMSFAGNDHDRPLTEKGLKDAARIALMLHASGVRPDLALVSPARRCRESFDAMAHTFAATKRKEHDRLYLATSGRILTAAEEAGQSSVMVIAHNPGLHELAASLCPQSDARYTKIMRKFPTAAAAVFRKKADAWLVHEVFFPRDVA